MEGLRLTDFVPEHPLQILVRENPGWIRRRTNGIFSLLGVRLGSLVTGSVGTMA